MENQYDLKGSYPNLVFFAKLGPMFMKKSLKFSLMSDLFSVTLPTESLNFDCTFFNSILINNILHDLPGFLDIWFISTR